MLQRVVLPQLGQTMEEGTIEKWHKNVGDFVKKGEVLFDLTTDKATLEVQAFVEGVVKAVLAPEGSTVPVNEVVALVGEEGDAVPDDLSEFTGKAAPAKASAETAAVEATPATTAAVAAPTAQAAGPGKLFASPRAKKVAAEQNVPVGVLRGSGPDGRIVERDVLAYVEQLATISYTPAAAEVAFDEDVSLLDVAATVGDRRVEEADVRSALATGKVRAGGRVAVGQTIELSPMRRTIAQRMAQSKQTVPHFYLCGDIMMRNALVFLAGYCESSGTKVTPTALIVKAMGIALAEHPRMNARYEGANIRLNAACNVGVAVSVDDGLFVPVVKDADRKTLKAIADEIRSLAAAARGGGLTPDQYEGGSVTLSNLGMFGVDLFQPIINPPESAIAGVGAIKDQVVAVDGGIRIEPVMTMTLAADHRVVDGVAAAEYFRTVRELITDPSGMD